MSAKRQHVSTCNNRTTPDEPPPQFIPIDLLLDIFARLDTAGIVRCAATSKPIRRAMTDPAFCRRLALRDEEAAGNGGVLLGVSYEFRNEVHQAPRPNPRFDAGLLKSYYGYEPEASRGGLVVLRHREYKRDLLVCNTLTGHTSHVPCSAYSTHGFPHALLAVGDGGRSFQLLFADRSLRTETYSSKNENTAVHWLYGGPFQDISIIIAPDVATARATLIELPPQDDLNLRPSQRHHKALQMAASPDGRLCLVVGGAYAITMWRLSSEAGSSTASASARWTRQMVIPRHTIKDTLYGTGYSVQFLGFGEMSGSVILQMDEAGIVKVNLRSKEPIVLSHDFRKHSSQGKNIRLCMHEADSHSLLQAMKPF
ncbi:hypothetical protein EJB05_04230, partial [Eragrostis curvula]